MVNFNEILIPCAAAISGGAAAAKLAVGRHQSVENMISQVDSDMAERIADLAESSEGSGWSANTDREFWLAIGGPSGALHLLAQARLLLRIVSEIRKDSPGLFEFEQQMLEGAIPELLLALIRSMGESIVSRIFPMRCIGAKVCAAVFANLAAEVENVVAEFQYGLS